MSKKSGGDARPEISKTPPLVSLAAGGVAGGIEAASTYPFEFAKTRVQLRTEKGVQTTRNPFAIIVQVYKHEGVRALYKGCYSMIVGSIGKDAVRFISFDTIKNSFADPQTGTLTPVNNLLAGMTAGVIASATAVTPSERIKTALIDDARGARRFHSTSHAIKLIWQERGLMGLYYGFAGNTLKQASATSVRMGTYNTLKDWETRRFEMPPVPAAETAGRRESRRRSHNPSSSASSSDEPTGLFGGTIRLHKDNPLTNFFNGMIAGIVTTYSTMPFDTIKTRSQSASGASTIEATRSIWADGGIVAFWRGTTMRLGRTIFSGGILFTVYERMVAVLNPLVGVGASNGTSSGSLTRGQGNRGEGEKV